MTVNLGELKILSRTRDLAEEFLYSRLFVNRVLLLFPGGQLLQQPHVQNEEFVSVFVSQ